MERGATQDFFMLALVILAAAGVLLAVNLGPTGKGGFLGIDDTGIQPTGDEHTGEPTTGDTSAGISDTTDIFGTGTRIGYFETCCIIGCEHCSSSTLNEQTTGDEQTAKGNCADSLKAQCKDLGGSIIFGPSYDCATTGNILDVYGRKEYVCKCTASCMVCKTAIVGGKGAGTTKAEADANCKANAEESCKEVSGTPVPNNYIETECDE